MKQTKGFTLIELIGVMAIMATLAAVIVPNVIQQIDAATQDVESKNLEAIGQGVEIYLRDTRAWPTLPTDLSPDYVHFGDTQITQNQEGYQRYFVAHPTTSAYNNAIGIAASDLPDARFLLISDLSQDAAPTVTTGVEFDNWWNTDETASPNLKIFRGNVGSSFHLLSLSAMPCAGGSYEINGAATDSGGAALATHTMYHVKGTTIGLDDADVYLGASPDARFALDADAGYRHCPNGWQPGVACGAAASILVRDEFNTNLSFAGNDGTESWSNDWQEIGESDGAFNGYIGVINSYYTGDECLVDNCLWVYETINGAVKGVSREVNLSCLSSATLTFSYKRDIATGGGVITLQASGDGGATWTTLQTYPMGSTDDPAYIPQTFDLTPYIATNTQIRFMTSGTGSSGWDLFNVEDVQIEAS